MLPGIACGPFMRPYMAGRISRINGSKQQRWSGLASGSFTGPTWLSASLKPAACRMSKINGQQAAEFAKLCFWLTYRPNLSVSIPEISSLYHLQDQWLASCRHCKALRLIHS